jgi:CRP-like cAMP-binding protein
MSLLGRRRRDGTFTGPRLSQGRSPQCPSRGLGNAMPFLALVSHQVIELRQHIELMKVRSAKERVMLYLDLHAGPDGHTVNLRGQLQDIASELGLTREALYRTLATL